MHELAVTESILEIALKHARQAGASRVSDIYLVIGKLSSIIDDSVQFYWEMIAEGSICDHARLHFQSIPARMKCNQCGLEFEMLDRLNPCPDCASIQLTIIAGEEFFVESIAIEK